MKPNQLIHQASLQEWSSRFSDQKASGLTARQWCEQNGFSIHQYNYWKHILKEELISQAVPEIVPLIPSVQTSSAPSVCADPSPSIFSANLTNCTKIELTVNGLQFGLDPDVPERFLITLLKAVRHV